MKNAFLQTLICILICIIPFFAKAQVDTQDSLALVDIYNATDGPNWTNNTNWLSAAPVSEWYGITLSNNRVLSINLSGNNLQNEIPTSLGNLTQLNSLQLENNQLTGLPDLAINGGINLIRVGNNRLFFDDLESIIFLPAYGNLSPTDYSPQYPLVYIEGFQTAYYGENITLNLVKENGELATCNFCQFEWEKVNSNTITMNNYPSYSFDVTSLENQDIYFCTVTSMEFDNLFINGQNDFPLYVTGVDGVGGEYAPNQIIIEFEPNTTQSYIDSLQANVGATKIDSCMCGQQLQLWQFDSLKYDPITYLDDLGDYHYFYDMQGVKDRIKQESSIDGIDFNYYSVPDGSPFTNTVLEEAIASASRGINNQTIRVGLIDTGIDDRASLAPYVYADPSQNGNDNDGNCLDSDVAGYNFANGDNNPFDGNGHGTIMAGIITSNLSSTANVEIVNLKVFDDQGKGDLFDATCAIYYGIEKEVDIYNLSWSYFGNPVAILKTALERAGTLTDALVIAAAGNGFDGFGANTNSFTFYPSNYDLDNLISVTAINSATDNLCVFSNYSDIDVDVAAPGWNIQPDSSYPVTSGTSHAAAFVTGAAINYLNAFPNANYATIKNALQQAVEPIPSLSTFTAWNGKLDVIDATSASIINASCGLNDGAISPIVTGGFPPYTYSWSTGATTLNISNLPSDIYSLTITDLVGSTLNMNYYVGSNGSFSVNVTDNGNGSATATPFGGTPPYSFIWTNGQLTSTTFTNGGNYFVQVTDNVGCQVTASTTIAEPPCAFPMMLSETVISGNVVRLDWTTNTDAYKYQVRYRAAGTATWTTVNATINQRFLNELLPSTTYEYQLKSNCISDNSSWTITNTFTTLADHCDRPESSIIQNLTATSAQINWTADLDDVKYKIRYKEFLGTWIEVFININSVHLSNLTPNTSYKYKLKTKCSNGWTNWGDKEAFSTPASFIAGEFRRNNNLSISIFPNPTSDFVHIESPKNLQLVRLYSNDGSLIKTVSPNASTTMLHLANLPNGFYYLSILQEDNSLISKKIVKQ